MKGTPHFKPKSCCDCASCFVPSGGRQERCAACREARNTKPKAHHDPRPCRECEEEFTPKAGSAKYCPRCRAKRKAMGAAKIYRSRKAALASEEISPAKPGARPGDFVSPSSNCHRCSAVVRLDRPCEYHVITKPGGKHWEPADRLLLCADCWRERRLSEISADVPVDGIFNARTAATLRCLTILLGLGREDRAAAWKHLGRAMDEVRQ